MTGVLLGKLVTAGCGAVLASKLAMAGGSCVDVVLAVLVTV